MFQEAEKPPTTLTKQHLYIIDYIQAGSKVLDIGCGTGVVGYALKDKDCYVVGVDIDSSNCQKAVRACHEIITADIEVQETLEKISGRFDYILFIDVLEHLKYPDKVLLRMKEFLSGKGVIITNIPSISFWTTRLTLLSGMFEYDPGGGIFSSGHLRFFNYYTMKKLFHNCGYSIEKIKPWFRFWGLECIGNVLHRMKIIEASFLNLFSVTFTFVVKPQDKSF